MMHRIITKFNQTCITCWNGKMTWFGKEPTICLRNNLFTYSLPFFDKTSCLFTMTVLSVCTWSYADLFMRWSEERIRLFSSYIQVAYLDFFFQFFFSFSNAGEGAIQKKKIRTVQVVVTLLFPFSIFRLYMMRAGLIKKTWI